MSKDPAFLFYPNDWIGGTMGMTLEEKGAYIELLIMQFNRGHMTGHMIGLIVGQLWDKVKDKFVVDDKGLYYNERLEIEQEKRKKFTESRRNNISGINQYSKPIKKVGHMTGHMEDRDINEDINKKEIENFIQKHCNGYSKELKQWIIIIEKKFNNQTSIIQLQSWLRLLNGWYKTTIQKKECLNKHIAGSWKTLNHVDIEGNRKDTSNSSDFKFPEQWKISKMSVTEYQDFKKKAREDGWKITPIQATGQTSFEKDSKQIII